eukprot:gi/632957950/ref/XP_007894763.1/ PREDICTED: TATA box-binding protein-associated factor RNA polymerase I subunit D [Callorhinchus milii]
MAAPLTDPVTASPDGSESDDSLFKTQCPSLPIRRSERGVGTLTGPTAADEDGLSDSEGAPACPPSFLSSEAFRNIQEEGGKSHSGEKSGRPIGRPAFTSPQSVRHKGLEFPFIQKTYGQKDLPFRMILNYEQASLTGLFDYIKEMKYQQHLEVALRRIDKDHTGVEKFEIKQYGYLDEKRAITPIDEACEESCSGDFETEERLGVKVVDNSFFIRGKSRTRKAKRQRKKIPIGKGDQGEGVKAVRRSERLCSKHKTKHVEAEGQDGRTSLQFLLNHKSSKHKPKPMQADPQQELVTEGSPLRKHSKRKRGHPEAKAETQDVTMLESPLQHKRSKRKQKRAEADKQHELVTGTSILHKRSEPKNGHLEAEAETQEDVTTVKSPLLHKSSKRKNKRAETDKQQEPVTEDSALHKRSEDKNGHLEAEAETQDATMQESPLQRKTSKHKRKPMKTDPQEELVPEGSGLPEHKKHEHGHPEAEAETQDVTTLQSPLQRKSSKRKNKRAEADKQEELATEGAVLPEHQKHERGRPEAEAETQEVGTALESALQHKRSKRKNKAVKANPQEELVTEGAILPKRKQHEHEHLDAMLEPVLHNKSSKRKKKRVEHKLVTEGSVLCKRSEHKNGHLEAEAETQDVTTQESPLQHQSSKRKPKPVQADRQQELGREGSDLPDHSKGKRGHLEVETQDLTTRQSPLQHKSSKRRNKRAEADKQHKLATEESVLRKHKKSKNGHLEAEAETQEGVITLDSPLHNNRSKHKRKPTKADPQEELVTEEAILPERKKHKNGVLGATRESPLQHKSSKRKQKRAEADQRVELETEGAVVHEHPKRKNGHPETETQEDVTTLKSALHDESSERKNERAESAKQHKLATKESGLGKRKKLTNGHPEAKAQQKLAVEQETLGIPLLDPPSDQNNRMEAVDPEPQVTVNPPAGKPKRKNLEAGGQGELTEEQDNMVLLSYASLSPTRPKKRPAAADEQGELVTEVTPVNKESKPRPRQVEKPTIQGIALCNLSSDKDGSLATGVPVKQAKASRMMEPNGGLAPSARRKCESKLERVLRDGDSLGSGTPRHQDGKVEENGEEDVVGRSASMTPKKNKTKKRKLYLGISCFTGPRDQAIGP